MFPYPVSKTLFESQILGVAAGHNAPPDSIPLQNIEKIRDSLGRIDPHPAVDGGEPLCGYLSTPQTALADWSWATQPAFPWIHDG